MSVVGGVTEEITKYGVTLHQEENEGVSDHGTE